jgi:glutamine synthetase
VQATGGAVQTVREVSGLVDELTATLEELVRQNADLGGETVHEKAYHMRDRIVPAMRAVREVVDRLEKVLPDEFWPLARYREMLFIK